MSSVKAEKSSGTMPQSPLEKGPSRARRRASELMATYGLVIVFILVMVVFAILRPSTFLTSSNINNILISQPITALLSLAAMVPLATNQSHLSFGSHVGI